MLKNRIRFTLLFLLLGAGLQAAKLINITPKTGYMMLGEYLSVYDDTSGKMDPTEVLKSGIFTPCTNTVPNLGFTVASKWVKFSIKNSSSDSNFLLQINQSLLDEAILFEFDEDGHLLKTTRLGEIVPIKDRKYKDQYLMYDVSIPKGAIHKYLFKIKSGEQILLPVRLSSLVNAQERNRRRDLLFGVYFGIILVMMAYNLFLFFTVKDNSYLYYVVYIFFVGFTQGVLEGYSFKYLWSENFWLAARSVYFSTSLVCVTSISFMRFFLHTKEYAPRMDKVIKYINLTFFICVVANGIVVNKYTHNLTQVAVGFVSFYILATSYVVFKKGYRTAKFFLIAWGVLIVGIFIFVLKDAGLIEANFFTTYTLQIGSCLEVVILSLALADRINILKMEKEASQAEALARLQENEKLILEQNVILEQKVRERTDELEVKNHELGVTLTHLKETQSQLVVVEKMASLGQLTAGIAHEINNPINFVSANIRPLQADIADILEVLERYSTISAADPDLSKKLKDIESFKEYVDIELVKDEINALLNGIEDGAKRTSEIVKGLKNFSHLDESDIKVVDVNTGIKSTLVLLRSTIPDNIEVELNLGEIPMIECYPGKLNQVFMNIMNNGIHAMVADHSKPKHKMSISTYTENETLVVSIADTGIGMDDVVKSKIFEPFYTTKDVGEGTGLGMSIVFGIIESHNGKILIDSEPGKGTLIKLLLPFKLKEITTNTIKNE